MVLLLALACHGTTRHPPHLTQIRVDPGELEITTGPAGGDPIQFTATGLDGTGAEIPLDVVEWSLSNRSVGELDENGLFTPATTNGGISWVKAKLGDAAGQATLTEIYSEERVDDGMDPSLFAAEGTPATDLWMYPDDGVNIPRNTPSLTFQWNDVGADGGYRLHFQSTVTDFTVFTHELQWTADAATWPTIVSTNAGGSVKIDLSALVGGETRTQPITVNVNRMDANGSILYWSTSASGIKEIPYGSDAVDFLTPNETGHCVACHSASRDGLIAFTYDGGNGTMGVKRISDRSDLIPFSAGQHANFTTFSPDGNYLLGASNGALLLWDAHTGDFLWEVPVDGYATHPDWSPDGSEIVFTSMEDGGWADWTFAGADAKIAVMDHYGDGTFGNQRVIYDPPSPLIGYYPAWSPDGEWIAFDESTGDAYDDPDATVWVIDRDGARAPIELAKADKTSGVTNSWPRWAPLPDDDVLWLAFASKRGYGRISGANPQIWVAGFDPQKARNGHDPSWPAFWLPGQDPGQSNHIPVWTE